MQVVAALFHRFPYTIGAVQINMIVTLNISNKIQLKLKNLKRKKKTYKNNVKYTNKIRNYFKIKRSKQ